MNLNKQNTKQLESKEQYVADTVNILSASGYYVVPASEAPEGFHKRAEDYAKRHGLLPQVSNQEKAEKLFGLVDVVPSDENRKVPLCLGAMAYQPRVYGVMFTDAAYKGEGPVVPLFARKMVGQNGDTEIVGELWNGMRFPMRSAFAESAKPALG